MEALPEENKDIVRRLIEEVWNRKNVEALEQFYPITDQAAQEYVRAAKGYVRTVHAAFPDLSVTLEDMIAEGDRVAVRTTFRGTYGGEAIADVPPTGRSFTVSGTVIWRVADGKIVEMWSTEDKELQAATQDQRSTEPIEPDESPVIQYLEGLGGPFKWVPWRCYWKC